ncbi:hypothetical protein IAU59_004161 [Kwoniella sp. CBS 9459]
MLIVVGGILATASSGSTPAGLLWMLTVSRGMVGVGVGGEYPACSTSASESANEKFGRDRGKVLLSSPTSCCLSAVQSRVHLEDLYGYRIFVPVSVFYFRLKMINSKLYRRNAIRNSPPYALMFKRYCSGLLLRRGQRQRHARERR